MRTILTFRKLLIKSLLLAVIFIFAACEKEAISEDIQVVDASAKASPAAQQGELTIAEIVVSNTEAEEPQFTLLLAALNYAGLTSVFEGEDNYTVFAPTDAAFLEFLNGKSLTDFTAEAVADILLYHVTDGRRFSNSVVPKNSPREIETLLGQYFYVYSPNEDGDIGIDTNDEDDNANAYIIDPNIAATNGVIHVIDTVLIPAE